MNIALNITLNAMTGTLFAMHEGAMASAIDSILLPHIAGSAFALPSPVHRPKPFKPDVVIRGAGSVLLVTFQTPKAMQHALKALGGIEGLSVLALTAPLYDLEDLLADFADAGLSVLFGVDL